MLPQRIKTKSEKAHLGKRSPAHRAWIRGFACSACGSTTAIECAHVRRASNAGMGIKPSDAFTVSLCGDCHRASHNGEQSFEAEAGVDLMALARRFYFALPHRAKMENPFHD